MAMKTIECICKNDYQDKRYGKGKRIANSCGRQGTKIWRCTVCPGKEKNTDQK